jgi:hypothetical protein
VLVLLLSAEFVFFPAVGFATLRTTALARRRIDQQLRHTVQ